MSINGLKINKKKIEINLEDFIESLHYDIKKQILKVLSESESLSMDDIISPIIKNSEAPEFIDYFLEQVDLGTVLDFIVERCNEEDVSKLISDEKLMDTLYKRATANPEKWGSEIWEELAESDRVGEEMEKYFFTKGYLSEITTIYEVAYKYHKENIGKLLEYANLSDHINMIDQMLESFILNESELEILLNRMYESYKEDIITYFAEQEKNILKEEKDLEYLKEIDFDVILDFVAKNIKKGRKRK